MDSIEFNKKKFLNFFSPKYKIKFFYKKPKKAQACRLGAPAHMGI